MECPTETEPGAAARTCTGGGAVSFQGACAKAAARRHFVWAAVAAALSHFTFLVSQEDSFSPIDSFQGGTHPWFPPRQHLLKVRRVAGLLKRSVGSYGRPIDWGMAQL